MSGRQGTKKKEKKGGARTPEIGMGTTGATLVISLPLECKRGGSVKLGLTKERLDW